MGHNLIFSIIQRLDNNNLHPPCIDCCYQGLGYTVRVYPSHSHTPCAPLAEVPALAAGTAAGARFTRSAHDRGPLTGPVGDAGKLRGVNGAASMLNLKVETGLGAPCTGASASPTDGSAGGVCALVSVAEVATAFIADTSASA